METTLNGLYRELYRDYGVKLGLQSSLPNTSSLPNPRRQDAEEAEADELAEEAVQQGSEVLFDFMEGVKNLYVSHYQ